MDKERRTMTPEERARWQANVEEHEAEREEVAGEMERFQRAAAEDSFSGHLRQAIHRSGVPMVLICRRSGIEWETLRAFLAGESPLVADVIDRIAAVIPLDVVAGRS